MSTPVKETEPKHDFMANALSVAIMVCLAAYTTTYDKVPVLHGILATALAGLTLGLVYVAMLTKPARTVHLLLVLVLFAVIPVVLAWGGFPQDFNVLLRYLTAIAGIFVFQLLPVSDLRRFFAYGGMIIIGYAAFMSVAGGPFAYAGTIRTFPFWSGLANSSFLIAALTITIALAPLRRGTRVVWVLTGCAVLAGYGAVTAVLMVALFFGGWYFLYRGWPRVWLYLLGLIAVVVGILFRNDNSVAGADIGSLGVGAIGSGRLDSWIGRLEQFGNRELVGQLVGFGPYSDYQVSGLWYWAAKNAHSDIITVLMEFGLFGLVAILLLSARVHKTSTPLEQIALLAIALGAAASNTFIDRPAVAIAWGMTFYACGLHRVGSKRELNRADRLTNAPHKTGFRRSYVLQYK
jgi:hypothetical protein